MILLEQYPFCFLIVSHKPFTCKDVNSFNFIISDMIEKARNTFIYFCKKGLFFWFPDVPVYQDFSRQVKVIAGKENCGKRMKWIHLLLVNFQNYQLSTSLCGQLNQIETELVNLNWISNFFFFVNFILGNKARFYMVFILAHTLPLLTVAFTAIVPRQSCNNF